MIPSNFEYFAPKSVQEVLGLLTKYPDEAKVLAGGHSLLPQMKLRLAAPKYLVDIGRIAGLSYIKEEGGQLLIGAMTTHYALESSTLLKEKCPLLANTAAEIGDVQVRNRGTIGGSLAHADPAADWPAAILALDGEVRLLSSAGERSLKAEDFFVDMLSTALQPNELLTEIRIPRLPAPGGSAYLKMHQRASGFAIVGVAVQLSLDSAQICQQLGIGITGVGSKPYRARSVENELKGKKLEAPTIAKAALKAAEGVDALSDLHASSEYRSHLASVFTRRALEAALAKVK
jgi:aerobic carbon-monoxide dehydrogenase medium subunit